MPYVRRDNEGRIIAITGMDTDEFVPGPVELYVPPPGAQREGDPGWFWLRLFTSAERSRWNLLLRYAATRTVTQITADPWLLAVVDAERDIAAARLISLDAASVVAGVGGICRHTFDVDGMDITVLATDARRDEVLAGLVVA